MTTQASYEELAIFAGSEAAEAGKERTPPIEFQDEAEWWNMGYDYYNSHKEDKRDA